jgi:3-oxoacyl-[acyl-carrier protein] reductase
MSKLTGEIIPTILVTGARKGIGRAVAEHYLSRGWQVAGCSRNETDLFHKNYRHFCLDVSDDAAVSSMVKVVAKDMGRLDALINNAGIAAMNHLTLVPSTQARAILETNVLGGFHCLREASKVMIRQKAGRIVNFSTVAVPLALEGEAVYAASKAAVETLTRVAAYELGSYGITVNAVAPTPVKTDLVKAVPNTKMEALLQKQAIRRWGEFSDVINVVDFFLRKESDFVTGQIIYLGGIG